MSKYKQTQTATSSRNKNGNLQRDTNINLDIRAIDEVKRTVELSFSSEQPYQRWFGTEILSHDAGAIDLSRLEEIGVLLFNHDCDYVLGKVLDVSIDDVGKRGVATVQFDADEDSDKIFQKVRNLTLKGVSVGYRVDAWEEVSAGSTSANGRIQGPASIATKWTPYEISIVALPADDSVGVGRDMGDDDDINQNLKNEAELLRKRTSNTILLNLGGTKK